MSFFVLKMLGRRFDWSLSKFWNFEFTFLVNFELLSEFLHNSIALMFLSVERSAGKSQLKKRLKLRMPKKYIHVFMEDYKAVYERLDRCGWEP